MIKTRLFATAAVLAAIFSAVPATAKVKAWQVGDDSMHLYYTGLDLNSAAGRAELLAQVERAATRLCRDRAFARECIADTVADTSRLPRAEALRVALAERVAIKVAAR